uniref:Uncharacterized protein n=1 Tax=Globodera rostochiensis TaxID=31243 RepID=A0A914H4V3_GLORO
MFQGAKTFHFANSSKTYSPCYFLENREGCPMCGWELCIVRTERLSCSCCAYDNLAFCRWQTSPGCTYLPDDKLAEDSPKCPDCKWKISYSDDDKKFQCCHRLTLHECTRAPATRAFVKSDDPLNKSTLVNVNAECKDLVDDQCHCGWGSCFPREGRAAGECCDKHHDLVCCEGRRRLELNGSNTKAEISKVFLMLLVMRLAHTVRPVFLLENAKGCPECGWEICVSRKHSLVCTCCDHSTLGTCRWGWTEKCLYEPNILSEPHLNCHNCGWKMRHSDKKFTCCDLETLKNCSAGLGIAANAPLLMQANVNKNDECQKLMEAQCDCKWGSCFPRMGRAASKCCTDNYDLVCCKGSNKADKSNGNASSIIAFFMTIAQLVVGRILT